MGTGFGNAREGIGHARFAFCRRFRYRCPDVYGVTVITHMSGFPHRAKVEAAFNAHGRTLDRKLRYEHYRQIFFGWTP